MDARGGLETWNRFSAPTPGFRERVFYHRPDAGPGGLAEARVENPALGLAFSVRFRPDELPEFVQWTMTGEGTYVLGLEPATCRVEGPAAEEAAGRTVELEPGETRSHHLEVSPITA
jgi:galactose mutarotase-like enzyme